MKIHTIKDLYCPPGLPQAATGDDYNRIHALSARGKAVGNFNGYMRAERLWRLI